ncbi:Predicted dehydrogenase [Collimonas sp. OK307]|uniref:oxidoreductase n=1 Tax=Collimonas sp. OK307 TaxID=1801620 RepID=UPI0008ED6F90|nr:oxidoreductase [Collimonas sp. OK307]SFI17342.1 Predicted dehydrogenase [Collimonas sp. OK307]
MSILKVGLLGYGFAGATFHAPLIGYSGRTEVSAIASSQTEAAAKAWPRARFVADLDGLLADSAIECIVIATPNDTHFEFARRVLAAGKHVVVDKPVTLSAAEARTLARMAADSKLLLAPFHNRRWDGDFRTLQLLVASGRLGHITHFESHFDRFRPLVRQRWRENALTGGGLLYDLGPHLIDQALTLFGAPQSVNATIGTYREHAQADDYVHLQLGYPDKQVVLHASALSALEAPRFVVHGRRGSYLKSGLDSQEDQLKAGLRPGQPGWAKNPPGLIREVEGELDLRGELATLDGAYEEFYRALAASVQDGAPFPVAADAAVSVAEILELARQSADEGRRLSYTAVGW